jgi:hypothetical protein
MPREQISRGRLRAQINVEVIDGGKVCVFCPAEISGRLYQHFAVKGVALSPPAAAMFSRTYPLHELTVTLAHDEALAEIRQFVAGLPEVCYERDIS